MIDLDKILEAEKVYELYEQVASNQVSKNAFISSIKDLVNKLLVVPVQLDKQDIASKLQGVVNDLNQDNVNIDVIINAIDKIYKRMKLAKKHSRELITIQDKLKYKLIENKELEYIKFDYHNMLNDILYKGFIVVGGEASSGKTSFISDLILDNINTLGSKANNTYLLLFTLDDSETKIYNKLNKQAHVRLTNVAKKWIQTNIYIERYLSYDTMYLVRQKVQEIKSRGDDVIVFIDYLQLVKVPASKFEKKQYIDNVVYELKALTIDFDITLYCISQLNRSGEGKYRYRESSEIENQAEICIDLDKNDNGMILVDFKKIKQGQTKTFITNVASSFLNFNELQEYKPKKSQWGKKW